MRLLEDMLSPEELLDINRVISSNEVRFDKLARIANLDPAVDFTHSDLRGLNFCGADLRGFNFTGSDIRHCLRDQATIIDGTTLFEGTQIEWVDINSLPIVRKMQKIQAAMASDERRKLLDQLISEFGRSDHVVSFMVAEASKSKYIEEFLDFARYIPEKLSRSQSEVLRKAGLATLKRKMSRSSSRTRREATANFAVDSIISKLDGSEGSLASMILRNLSEVLNEKRQTKALNGFVSVERSDVESAISRIAS